MKNAGGERKGTMNKSIIYHTPICYRCDRFTHPSGKVVVNDLGAIKTESGEWICSECQVQENNKKLLTLFGGRYYGWYY
jgi:hypothetical protein